MIELGALAWLAGLGGLAVIPATVLQSKVVGWLGRRRNRKGQCSRCRGRLYEDTDGPWRVGGVLYCTLCASTIRRRWTGALWVAAASGIGLGLMGAAGVAGLLPFVAGGGSLGAIAGLLVPPLAVGGAAWFQLKYSKRENARAEIEEGGEGWLELQESSEDRDTL